MATYFISDLHLDNKHPLMLQGFLNFLEDIKDAETLYILGDFFEVWIGDDAVTPLSQQVAHALAGLSDSGCQVYLMHGNRDFLIGEAFCQAAKSELIQEETQITLGNESVVLLHGDSLCTEDVDYQKFRLMCRSPQWQQQVLSLSIEQRIAMAQQARAESKSSMEGKDMEIMDVTQAAVDDCLNKAGVHTMIHGHTHRPHDHQWSASNNSMRRIVLGDWSDSHGWMIRWTESDGLVLSQFPLRH